MDKIAALMIDAVEHPSHAKQRIAALEAEVARLREALAGLLLVRYDSYSPTCGCDICRAVEVGRAALEQKGEG